MIRRTFLALTAACTIAMPAFAGGHSKDIVDTAVAAGSFNTLAAALTAAGLVDTLRAKVHSPYSHQPMPPSPHCPPARWKTC